MDKLRLISWSTRSVFAGLSRKSLYTVHNKWFSDAVPKSKNLYNILCVSEKATQAEIKDAYYDLTLKFHPDRNEGSPEAATKFREITEAYEILGNYFLRRRYDRGLPIPTKPEPAVVQPEPHVVKYQKFFDSRNLPYEMSARRTRSTSKRVDLRQKVDEPLTQVEVFERVLNDPDEVRHRQNCLVVSILMLFVITQAMKRSPIGVARPEYPCGMNVEREEY